VLRGGGDGLAVERARIDRRQQADFHVTAIARQQAM